MEEYIIDVTKIEEWQTIRDLDALDRVFQRARSTIVNGERVVLTRSDRSGRRQAFDELTTLDDLELYKTAVFRYL
ncbi:hypothetical protein [Flaviaesturariibacter aridisoli]|uniref:Uncharacterized protein n=1 Tax=Flaviaesturariibacter aridisoli TaxID=2545761 RepID=A0A4R4E529_9BACT|nr:hypothetical protein [Flaviaesturariibacter aridisoli]TCZ74097.1 hypothetical protein E0486_03205 [Flaviaesturariibacter aridisoli]